MQELSAFPGVTRRDFLKICGGLAALIGLGQAGAADVAQALEAIAKRPNVIWSDFQECLGCSVNLLQSRTPQVASLILQQISLNYHEAVMAPAGDEAEKSFDDTVAGGRLLLGGRGRHRDQDPRRDDRRRQDVDGHRQGDLRQGQGDDRHRQLRVLRQRAGGAAEPDGRDGRRRLPQGRRRRRRPGRHQHVPLPGQRRGPARGAHLRPRLREAAASSTRSAGRSSSTASSSTTTASAAPTSRTASSSRRSATSTAPKSWCLYKVGCKGPVTYAPCPVTRWNGHQSWCVKAGPCIGCSEPELLGQHDAVLLADAQHRRARHRRRLRPDVHRDPRRRRPPWPSARTSSGRSPRIALHGGGPMDEPPAAVGRKPAAAPAETRRRGPAHDRRRRRG